jgi:hypothetical protein
MRRVFAFIENFIQKMIVLSFNQNKLKGIDFFLKNK